ncbi:hypothetical protein FA13DRAFT_1820568 [Coprinellus micaceus]|uniref:Uncharacterized protein n=1 Tax=Coprinellus micaceus TaxID=71717 RepID=A0A4Y7SDV6_COPMI|nr:hypothetical protein FA13DRAFT_1820568 [Coprinellus micaceus]
MGRRDKKNAEENPPVLPKTPTKASMSTDDPAPPSTPPPTTPTFTLNQSPRTPKGSVWKRFAAVGRVMLAVTPKLTPAPVASTSAIPEASPLSHLTSRIFEFSAPPPNWFEAPPSPSSPSFRYPFFPLRHNAKPTPAISSVTKRARSDSSLSEMGSPVKELKRLRLATPSEDGSIDSDSDATGSAITSLTSDNDDRGDLPTSRNPLPPPSPPLNPPMPTTRPTRPER